MVTALVASVLLGSQQLSPSAKLKALNGKEHHIVDTQQGVIYRVKQPIPKFACMSDFSVTNKVDRTIATVVMRGKRPARNRDFETIDFRWMRDETGGKSSSLYLIILEGGGVPHRKLRGRISVSQCVLIRHAKRATIVGSYLVSRHGNTISVSMPRDMFTNFRLEQVCTRWLPSNVMEPFKSNGVFGYAANSVVLSNEPGSYGVGSLNATLDDLP